jgi:hypothetical protein
MRSLKIRTKVPDTEPLLIPDIFLMTILRIASETQPEVIRKYNDPRSYNVKKKRLKEASLSTSF